MRNTFVAIAAITLTGLSVPPVRAADTVMLGGVGSLNDSRSPIAPVITLKGSDAMAADTIAIGRGGWGGGRVAVGGFHGGGVRTFARTTSWGWRGGAWGWNRPWVGAWAWNRPWIGRWGWNRPWVGWPGVSIGVGYVGTPVIYSSSSICSCPSYAPAPPLAGETGPPPRPNEGFPYDGGPAKPIPPIPPTPVQPRTPPVPMPPPAISAVVRRPARKLEYPAYGEGPSPVKKATDTLFVKRSPDQ